MQQNPHPHSKRPARESLVVSQGRLENRPLSKSNELAVLVHPIRCFLVVLLLLISLSAGAADFMFEADFDGQLLEGRPLFWTDTRMLLLGRDGAMHTVDPRDAERARRTAPRFQGYSTSEMRNALYQEFGDAMTVSSTGHYLVAHRSGESDAWAQRFEDLYRSFCNYFRVRGFQLSPPPYPLVAVVFDSEREYRRYAQSSGVNLQPNTLGHYDQQNNRVLMYDRVASSERDWGITANTIVHEATHQTAYNVGIHNRAAENPVWVVEGLATMFEARGVYQSRASDTIGQRINRGRLDDFRFHHDGRQHRNMIANVVASDKVFSSTPERAYADAWALTLFLSETRPKQYEQYLQRISRRRPLTNYWASERMSDFQEVFGDDLDVLENNFFAWMGQLH